MRPLVTWGLATAAGVVTLAGALVDELPFWLRPLDHGFYGLPGALHLLLNLLLLFFVGSRLERWIGHVDYSILIAAAYAAYLALLVLADTWWGLDAVGLSGVIWAMILPAWFAAPTDEARADLRPALWLMLLVIPAGFGLLVASLTDDDPLLAGLAANIFHAAGVAVGAGFAVWWVRRSG